MRNLLQLVTRVGGLILFLVLEVICFVLIVSFNKEQKQIFLSSANLVTGSVYNQFSSLRDYVYLGRQNRQLLEDNRLLLAENERLQQRLSRRREELLDSIPPSVAMTDSTDNVFEFIGVQVIKNSITANDNILTLDKGSKAGVRPHAGVINGRGIVGVVRDVSEHYASVMSVLHRQTRISASIKGKHYFGTLVWRGETPRFMNMEAVPKYAEIEKGDIVQTSGYSFKFPSGIMVGTVEEVREAPGDNFLEISVRLVNDLSRLEYAYVSIHKGREEWLTIERKGEL